MFIFEWNSESLLCLFDSMSSTAKHIVDYIPFGILLLLSYLPWKDPFVGWMALAFLWPLLLGAIVWAAIVLSLSIERGGKHLKGILIALGFVVLSFSLIFLVRIPSYNCDPYKMARHYEKVKREMDELVFFTRKSLNEGDNMVIDSEGDICKVEAGNGPERDNRGEWYEKKDSPLLPAISKDNAKTIRTLLKKTGCFHLETHFPDYCRLRYKDVGLGAYFYRIYLSPMTEEQMQNAINQNELIPYSDRVVFEFGGGAVGPQAFNSDYKKVFLKKLEEGL